MIWIVDSVLCAIAVASLILALRVPRGAEEPPTGADEPDDAPGEKPQPKDLLRSQKSQRAGQPVTVPDELSS